MTLYCPGRCFYLVFVSFILNFAAGVRVDLGLQSFSCSYLQFSVTYDVSRTRLILIESLVANCSNGSGIYTIGDFMNLDYHNEGQHRLHYLFPPSLQELTQCFLSGMYRNLGTIFKDRKRIESSLSCTLPKTNVSVTPSYLEINSSRKLTTTASFNCSVKSSAYVNITWWKNGSLLIEDSNWSITYAFLNETPYYLLTVSTLSFATVQPSDSGCYECTSTGPVVNGVSQVNSASGCLEISLSEPERHIITSFSIHEDPSTPTNTHDIAGIPQSNTLLYKVIAALASAVVIFATCTIILTAYCLWLRATRRNKINMHAFAIIYPTTSEINNFDIEPMKTPGLNVLSESTPSLLEALNSANIHVSQEIKDNT